MSGSESSAEFIVKSPLSRTNDSVWSIPGRSTSRRRSAAAGTAPPQFWEDVLGLFQPGERLANGRFEIRRILGRGGISVVYEARDEVRQMAVALKFLSPALLHDARAVEQFLLGGGSLRVADRRTAPRHSAPVGGAAPGFIRTLLSRRGPGAVEQTRGPVREHRCVLTRMSFGHERTPFRERVAAPASPMGQGRARDHFARSGRRARAGGRTALAESLAA